MSAIIFELDELVDFWGHSAQEQKDSPKRSFGARYLCARPGVVWAGKASVRTVKALKKQDILVRALTSATLRGFKRALSERLWVDSGSYQNVTQQHLL